MSNAKKGTKPPKPLRIPRPSDKPKKKKRKPTSAELAAFFGKTGKVVYTGSHDQTSSDGML